MKLHLFFVSLGVLTSATSASGVAGDSTLIEDEDDNQQREVFETAFAADTNVGDPVASITLKNGKKVEVFEDDLSIQLGHLSRRLLDGCGDGLYEAPDGRCRDVNECKRGTHTCVGEGKKCVNNISSFVCNCKDGYYRKGAKCLAEQTCSTGQTFVAGLGCLPDCDEGYKRNSQGSCVDYDECKHNPCPQGVQCTNTEGSYTCASCKPGFEGTAPSDCTDVDECTEGTDTCGPQSTCFNLLGSYGCQCNEGFDKDANGICADIDECDLDSHDCHSMREVCVNEFGTYRCACANGFTFRNGLCRDINECRLLDVCPGVGKKCVNGFGSYVCNCIDGYQRKGSECIPVTE